MSGVNEGNAGGNRPLNRHIRASFGRSFGPLFLFLFMGLSATVALGETPSLAPLDSGRIAGFLKELLASDNSAPAAVAPREIPALRRFYEGRAYRPAWFELNRMTSEAVLVRHTLAHADDDGLDPADYDRDALTAIPTRTADAAKFDIVLTENFVHYAHDIRFGRVQAHDVDRDVDLPVESFDPASALATALDTNSVAKLIAALPPSHAEYARLKSALVRYRELAAAGGWPEIPAQGELKLDGEDTRLALLIQRLKIENPTLSQAELLDASSLRAAVEKFQTRNGLESDGRVGTQTLRALNVSAIARIAQIRANMERWRWTPRSFGPRYIEINAADATLRAVDDGKTVLTSRVIVGKRRTPTPMFAAVVAGITVNPFWNIPPNIARNEILPKARRNPDYLASNHISIDSSGALQQAPGADNALGLLKLEMPNRFNSYLHDTPSRSLFKRDERHLSHGCMRVEQIQPLASFVLTGDSAAGLEKIQAAIAAGDNARISLDKGVPVFVLYWTAIANLDGTAEFRSDVYGRDQRLLAALAGQHQIGRVTMNADAECQRA